MGLSQLGVTEADEPALLWDVVLCGVGLFGSRSKPVVWLECVSSRVGLLEVELRGPCSK